MNSVSVNSGSVKSTDFLPPWNFGGVFTIISCPMKNPTEEKNPIGLFFQYGRKNPKIMSDLFHLGEILQLAVSNGVSSKQ
jgi:hypothetical protein